MKVRSRIFGLLLDNESISDRDINAIGSDNRSQTARKEFLTWRERGTFPLHEISDWTSQFRQFLKNISRTAIRTPNFGMGLLSVGRRPKWASFYSRFTIGCIIYIYILKLSWPCLLNAEEQVGRHVLVKMVETRDIYPNKTYNDRNADLTCLTCVTKIRVSARWSFCQTKYRIWIVVELLTWRYTEMGISPIAEIRI